MSPARVWVLIQLNQNLGCDTADLRQVPGLLLLLTPLNELSDPVRGSREARHGAGDVNQPRELEHEVHADKPSLRDDLGQFPRVQIVIDSAKYWHCFHDVAQNGPEVVKELQRQVNERSAASLHTLLNT